MSTTGRPAVGLNPQLETAARREAEKMISRRTEMDVTRPGRTRCRVVPDTFIALGFEQVELR